MPLPKISILISFANFELPRLRILPTFTAKRAFEPSSYYSGQADSRDTDWHHCQP